MNIANLELARRVEDLNKPSEETVAPVFACPCCGERRTDWLYWNKAGTVVTCSACGADYDPCEV